MYTNSTVMHCFVIVVTQSPHNTKHNVTTTICPAFVHSYVKINKLKPKDVGEGHYCLFRRSLIGISARSVTQHNIISHQFQIRQVVTFYISVEVLSFWQAESQASSSLCTAKTYIYTHPFPRKVTVHDLLKTNFVTKRKKCPVRELGLSCRSTKYRFESNGVDMSAILPITKRARQTGHH